MLKLQLEKIQKAPIIYIWAFIIGLFVLTLGILSSRFFSDVAQEDESDHLYRQAKLISAIVTPESIGSLTAEPGDTSNPTYSKLKNEFERFCNQLTSIRYIYLLKERKEEFYFYLDTESETNQSTAKRNTSLPGERLSDAPKEFQYAYHQKNATIIQPHINQRGTFVSILIPIQNNKGEAIALLGMDVDNSYWESSLRIKRAFPIAVSLIFISIILFAAILLRHKIDTQKNKLHLASQLEKFFAESNHATIFFSTDFKVLFFNKKAVDFEKSFLNQPFRIGKRFIDHVKDEMHKFNLIKTTQTLISQMSVDLEIEIGSKNYTLQHRYIQPAGIDAPFISLTVIDTTKFNQAQLTNTFLKNINNTIEEETTIFSIITDHIFNIEYTSDQVQNLLGYPNGSLIKQSISSILQIDSFGKLTELLAENSQKTEFNTIFKSAKNQQKYFSTKVTKLPQIKKSPLYLFVSTKNDTETQTMSQQTISEIFKAKEVIDSLPGFAYRCKFDLHWTMYYLSEGFEKLTGYSPSDVLINQRISYNDIIIPKYRQYIFDYWEECLRTKSLFDAEYEILTATGEHKWVWEQGYGSYDNDGNVTNLHGFILDVSPYKNTIYHNEKEIDSLKSYIDDAKQGFLQIDSSTSIIRANTMMIGLLHKSIDIIRGQKLSDIIHPSSADKYTLFINQLLNQHEVETDLDLIDSENRRIPTLISGKKHGENNYILNIIDLSSIPLHPTTQTTTPPEWKNILHSIETPICVIDNKLKSICYSNDQFLTFDPKSIFGALCNSEDNENMIDSIIELGNTTRHLDSFEMIDTIDTNNEIHKLTPIIKSITTNNKSSYTIVFLLDNTITANNISQLEARINQLENKFLSKIHFFVSACNDIRSTLNGIIGYTETTLHTTNEPIVKKAAQNTKELSKKTLEKINSILDLSNIESGNVNYVFEPFNPEDLLSNLLMTFAPICEKKGIRINANIDFNLLRDIVCDEILIKKAISGILSTVIEQTQIGSISISYAIQNQGNTHWLKITITNTGMGLPIEMLQSTKSHPSYDQKNFLTEPSTDIDFAICLNIIELLNGTIQISNRIGLGSVLEIAIPILLTDLPSELKLQPEHPFNALIASPYNDDLTSIDQILSHYHANIYSGATGIEAAQIISNLFKEDEIIDFAFLDYNLNGMSYKDVMNTLTSNGCENIYIVCKHTEYEDIRKKNPLIPPNHILPKPILPTTLKNILNSKQSKTGTNPLAIDFVRLPSSFSILVVEDNSINLLMLKEILSMSGATVYEALDGQEAYISFLKNQPDLIFMDIHMPIINGFESTKMIRDYCRENENHKNPTIIALTANTINNLKINYQSYELDGFISKPYQIIDIQNCLIKFKTDDKP